VYSLGVTMKEAFALAAVACPEPIAVLLNEMTAEERAKRPSSCGEVLRDPRLASYVKPTTSPAFVTSSASSVVAHDAALRQRLAELERKNQQLLQMLAACSSSGVAATLTFSALSDVLPPDAPSCVAAVAGLEAANVPDFARVDFSSLLVTAQDTAQRALAGLPSDVPRLPLDAAVAVAVYSIDSPNPASPVTHAEEKFYVCLNAVLRKLTPAVHAALKDYMGHLLRAFRMLRVPTAPLTCYRGLPAAAVASGALNDYQKGAVAHWQAVTSASRSERVAAYFAGAGGVVLVVTVHECADIDAYSYYYDPDQGEQEVVLPPATTLTVQQGLCEAPAHSHAGQVGAKLLFLEQSKVVHY
jgi:hypothetical protein